jgi:hypothetical protein
MMPPMIWYYFISLPLIFTLSCGGGGGGENNTETGDGDTLNSGLEGKFLFDYYGGDAYTMDVDTGEYSQIPNTHWASQTDRFDYDAVTKSYFVSSIEHNNSEFLVTASGSSISYIAMQDFSGNYMGQLKLVDSVKSAVMSQDKKYVAIIRKITGGDTWLEIYAWDGTLISDKVQRARGMIWLRDNRLLYPDGRSLYFTKPASTNVDHTLTLPNPGNGLQAGSINNSITISPDESQIAFTIVEEVGSTLFSRLYMVNIDGSELRLLATTYNDENPRISSPQWSPDGRWLYIEEGYINTSVHTIGTKVNADMYVLPTENMGKVYYLSTDDSKRSPEVRMFWRYNTLGNEPGGVTSKAPPGAFFNWIPD